MKRIIFLIFFSLALVAIPFAAFASDTEATSTEEVLIEAYSAEYYPTPTPTPTPEPSPTPTPEPTPTPTPENHLPIFSGPANASTTLGVTLEFEVTATDPDGDILELSSVLPEGALWATSTVKFTWTPVATSSLGTTTAKFFAFDCIGTSTHEVVIEVFPAISASLRQLQSADERDLNSRIFLRRGCRRPRPRSHMLLSRVLTLWDEYLNFNRTH